MHITQGTFSYLPEFTDEEIRLQVQYGIDKGWAPLVEFTDDAHPRNVYWHMWGMPMFDLEDATAVVNEINRCREAYPDHYYIRVTLYDASRWRSTSGLQFLVQRPEHEPGFRLNRNETNDRRIQYSLHSYAAEQPHGQRYRNEGS